MSAHPTDREPTHSPKKLATPRTDAAEAASFRGLCNISLAFDFARQLERELIAATTANAERIEACATLITRAIANEQARDELHRILVMLKREMDEHVSDKTKIELPKAAWHSACDRANAVMANFLP